MSNKKRNLELISKILLVVEESDAEEKTTPELLTTHELIKNYDKNVVFVHVRLLHSKGLIDVRLRDDLENKDYLIEGITWEGYDYLDKARKKIELLGRAA